MKRHLLVHTGEQPFICEFCSYTSNRKSNLKAHQSKYHKEQVENKHWIHIEIFWKKCIDFDFFLFEVIFKIFKWSIFLQIKPIHIGTRQYGCPFCAKIMKSMGDMKRHIMFHTGEKPFSCEYCPYSSSQKVHLNSHVTNNHKL